MSFLSKIFGDVNQKIIKQIEQTVVQINQLEPTFESFSDEQLLQKSNELRAELTNGKKLDDILPEVFAMTREASKRTLKQRHYDVQLIGGIVIHRGQIAEMKTGEGKTLTSTCPVVLNALTGKGVHLITVNDYLAKRDAAWMGQIYHKLGLSVACIEHDAAFMYDPGYTNQNIENDGSEVFKIKQEFLRPVSRQEAYLADITYGTNNEFGFDYLRDNMIYDPKQKSQRNLNFAIIDEVDSILIDEARTPLIISSPDQESTDKYKQFSKIAKGLIENEDYNVDEKMKAVALTEEGIAKVEKILGIDNIYTEGGVMTVHHLEQALKAEVLFKLDINYVVKDGEVMIIDEFTGRMMPGRRYSEGLHQAIEAKENVEIQRESRTLATISLQNYFRMYHKLAGMTGTAESSAEEFSKVYNLDVTVIPTNKELKRKFLPDKIFKTEVGKFRAVVRDVKQLHEAGRPVLIGTISIEKNELLGQMFAQEGIDVELLNAKNHLKEAEIISQAGRLGAVTVATNMAGRGVDIILGGNPVVKAEQEKVVELGGLHVIGTERHEARRIDDQLRGRTGRQGDPGSAQFYVSLEDDLMRVFGSDKIKSMMTTLNFPEDMPIENGMVTKALDSAQSKVEGYHFDSRKHLLDYDDVMNKHRQAIYQKREKILFANEALENGEANENQVPNRERILQMVESEIEEVVMFHTSNENEKKWNLDEIFQVAGTIFPLTEQNKLELKNILAEAGDQTQDVLVRTKIIEQLNKLAHEKYDEMVKQISNDELMIQIEKSILLRSIDTLWIDHLEAMEYLRTGIGLRGYAQRDPLVEYKKEAFGMFNELNNGIRNQVVYSIYKVVLGKMMAENLSSTQPTQNLQFQAPAKTMERGQNSIEREASSNQTKADNIAVKPHNELGEKIGRNDLCPCGSGKKYKKCCGK
ncbi:MAG: preprotein translocase subunit SecA [Patescibacteria group bacterium]